MGDPLLLQQAKPVEQFDTPELHALIADMQDTMTSLNGAGLAAPQIGVSLQVVISESARFSVSRRRIGAAHGLDQSAAVGARRRDGGRLEGCLSVPGMRGLVPRYKSLRYQGRDQYGKEIDRTVADFHARVVQHEVDHLFGILYPMRIRDMRFFGFNETLFPGEDLKDD